MTYLQSHGQSPAIIYVCNNKDIINYYTNIHKSQSI